jgi:restriction system protein
MSTETCYEILGVQPNATPDEIRTAYRRLVRQVHPDQGGSNALFRVVRGAYDVLSDEDRRRDYDARLARGESAADTYDFGDDDEDFDDEDFDDEDFDDEDFKKRSEKTKHESAKAGQDRTGTSQSRNYASTGGDRTTTCADPAWTPDRGPVVAFAAAHPSLLVLIGGWLIFIVGGAAHSIGFDLIAMAILAIGVCGLVGHRRAMRVVVSIRAGMANVDRMSGTEFVRYLEIVFRGDGASVQHTGRSGDYGADLVLTKGGVKTVVQTKRSSSPVGPAAIREAAAARPFYGAQAALVVTNSFFTTNAINLASSNQVSLWDRQTLASFLAKRSSAPMPTGWALLRLEIREGAPAGLRRVSPSR